MNSLDAQKVIGTNVKNQYRKLGCTRWEEMKEYVNDHIQLSAMINAPTIFRLLNPCDQIENQQFSVSLNGSNPSEVSNSMSLLSTVSPNGVRSFTKNLRHIRFVLSPISAKLQANRQKVALIIATDGMPTDSNGTSCDDAKKEFEEALNSLEKFPVSIVIRLFTKEDEVVKYYNEINHRLELAVLDDFYGEASTIDSHNKWLTYGVQLHRCREFGLRNQYVDFLNMRALTLTEIRDFCCFLFGESECDSVPDPTVDLVSFFEGLKQTMNSCSTDQWNPIKLKVRPWIDLKEVADIYAPSCSIM